MKALNITRHHQTANLDKHRGNPWHTKASLNYKRIITNSSIKWQTTPATPTKDGKAKATKTTGTGKLYWITAKEHTDKSVSHMSPKNINPKHVNVYSGGISNTWMHTWSLQKWQWNRMWNLDNFIQSWAALLYALWAGSCMVSMDVIFQT
jgi:hypothetical protein